MENVAKLFESLFPLFEGWLRTTVSDEVSKALEADHQKQKPKKQYTRQEVCAMAHISMPNLWQKTRNGEIKATKIGRRVLYDEAEVMRFLGK